MALNGFASKFAKEKSRIEDKKAGQFEKTEWFAPKKGENQVRFIINPKHKNDPFITVRLHQLPITKKDGSEVTIPVHCLNRYDGDDLVDNKCPFCEQWKRLQKRGRKEEAKAYNVSERTMYLVLDYANRQVLPWTAPASVHSSVVDYTLELQEQLFDLDEGHDFKVTKDVDPSKGKQFGTSYKATLVVKPSAVPEKLRPLIAEAPDLRTIYGDDKDEDTKKKMNAFLGLEEKEEETPAPAPKKKVVVEEEEEEEPAPKPKKKVVVEEEEEEEPAPKPKKKVVEEEEPAPKPKKKVVVEEEEPAPKPKKKAVVETDDEDIDQELARFMNDDE